MQIVADSFIVPISRSVLDLGRSKQPNSDNRSFAPGYLHRSRHRDSATSCFDPTRRATYFFPLRLDANVIFDSLARHYQPSLLALSQLVIGPRPIEFRPASRSVSVGRSAQLLPPRTIARLLRLAHLSACHTVRTDAGRHQPSRGGDARNDGKYAAGIHATSWWHATTSPRSSSRTSYGPWYGSQPEPTRCASRCHTSSPCPANGRVSSWWPGKPVGSHGHAWRPQCSRFTAPKSSGSAHVRSTTREYELSVVALCPMGPPLYYLFLLLIRGRIVAAQQMQQQRLQVIQAQRQQQAMMAQQMGYQMQGGVPMGNNMMQIHPQQMAQIQAMQAQRQQMAARQQVRSAPYPRFAQADL